MVFGYYKKIFKFFYWLCPVDPFPTANMKLIVCKIFEDCAAMWLHKKPYIRLTESFWIKGRESFRHIARVNWVCRFVSHKSIISGKFNSGKNLATNKVRRKTFFWSFWWSRLIWMKRILSEWNTSAGKNFCVTFA